MPLVLTTKESKLQLRLAQYATAIKTERGSFSAYKAGEPSRFSLVISLGWRKTLHHFAEYSEATSL